MNLNANAFHVIAHRGASGVAPENTLIAIEEGIKQGAKYIEIDVHMTSDNQIVAIHDLTVGRTTNGKGDISSFTLSEIQKLDAGSFFSPKYKGEKVPSLEEVFKVMKIDTILIIEVKDGSDRYKNIEKIIADLVSQYKLEKNVIFKSFRREVLNEFKKLSPQVERLYCVLGSWSFMTIDIGLKWGSMFNYDDVSYYQVHRFFLSQSMIDEAHKKNKKIVVWDVHEKEDILKFKKMGVNFIESDFPKRVLETN